MIFYVLNFQVIKKSNYVSNKQEAEISLNSCLQKNKS